MVSITVNSNYSYALSSRFCLFWQPLIENGARSQLTQNCVDVCLTGLTRREEIDAAIAGVEQGKLTAAEIEYLNIYGDLHRERLSILEIPPERLLYRA